MDITTGEMSIAQFLRARYLSILLRRLNCSKFTSAKRAEINCFLTSFFLKAMKAEKTQQISPSHQSKTPVLGPCQSSWIRFSILERVLK